MRKNKAVFIDILVIVLFSLIPFLWFAHGQIIAGHDAGFPFSPWQHFSDRLFLWTQRFGLGDDQATAVGGFFIHGFEGLVSKIGFSLTQVQQITFSAYFFGFGISMYLLAREVFKDKRYIPLLAAVMYMLNHFLLQGWFIAERTKFSLYIALPLIVMLVFKLYHGKLKPLTAAIFASFIIFFLNGGGFFPLYGAFLITLPFIMLLLIGLSDKKLRTLAMFFQFSVFWVVGSFLLNAYWILPTYQYASTSFGAELSLAGGKEGVLGWVQSISENASYYNIFRLQGIQEWYVNPLHPYAQTFLGNPFFFVFSHFLPLLIFGSLLVSQNKERKLIAMWAGLVLVSILFMAGSHPPFGFFYVWMIQHIPGFIVFRTPYYKFAPALWLSASLLIAYTLNYLLQKVPKVSIQAILVVMLLAGWSVYNFPFFTGVFTDYEVGQKTTKVTVPDYVLDYGKWANSPEFTYNRLLVLPGQNVQTHYEAYTWGYWSLAQLQSLLTNSSYISNVSFKGETEESLIKNIYALIAKRDPSWIDQAQYLFVDGVLLRKDFDYKLAGSETESPFLLEDFLNQDSRFAKVKEFGPWVVYELKGKHADRFALKDYYYEVQAQNPQQFFEPSTLPGVTFNQNTIFIENDIANFTDHKKGEIYVPRCLHCLLDEKRLFDLSQSQVVTAGSIFYNVKINKDKLSLAQVSDTKEKLKLSAVISFKRLNELRSQFLNKDPVAERIVGWNSLYDAFTEQEKILNEYMGGITNYTLADNEYLSILQENLTKQLEELQLGLEQLNQANEADVFIKTQNKIHALMAKINERLQYSSENVHKKYLVEVDQADTYSMFAKIDTVNSFHFAGADQNVKVINNDVEIPTENIVLDTKSEWVKLAGVPLKQGQNYLELVDNEFKIMLGDQGKLSVKLTPAQACTNIPLGTLEKGWYTFNVETSTIKDMKDLYVFVDLKTDNRPLLPYWGRKILVDGQKTEYLHFNEETHKPGEYEMKFCRLNTIPFETIDLNLNNLYVERISSPHIALLKLNLAPLAAESQLKLTTTKNNQVNYDLAVEGTGAALLMFDQRYDNNWIATPEQFLTQHSRLHGYANGWVIQKQSPELVKAKIEYRIQDTYRKGWIISLITSGLFITYLVWVFVKKKRLQ